MLPANASVKATPWAALGGQYELRPGAPHSIVGQRPVLGAGRLGRMLHGQRGEEVARMLGSVFTLCAHAHRRTAELALAAAQSDAPAALAGPEPVSLWVETARDHLRSIALEWPQRLPDLTACTPSLDWLRDCPLTLTAARPLDAPAAGAALLALREWLAQRVLQQPVSQWLLAHRHPDALARWCAEQSMRLTPARCLAGWRLIAHHQAPEMRSLDLLDADPLRQAAQMRELAQLLVTEPNFGQQPLWQGQCAETGPWTRLRQRARNVSAPHSAWTRLSARWLELMEIAAAEPDQADQDGFALLSSGALSLGNGQALAWCEMARGLLLHWVQVDVQVDAQGAVEDYRVVAPTEWNFHPQGALGRAVAALAPRATPQAQLLAAAFDPCVPCTVQAPGV